MTNIMNVVRRHENNSIDVTQKMLSNTSVSTLELMIIIDDKDFSGKVKQDLTVQLQSLFGRTLYYPTLNNRLMEISPQLESVTP